MREIHPDFHYYLDLKTASQRELFKDVREYVLSFYLDANELLYHTHALTSVFSISERLSDAYIMLPMYKEHMNLGFNKGTLLPDPSKLLTGTGKLIRHIPISDPADYRNPEVAKLIKASIDFAINDMEKPAKKIGETISNIKRF